MLTVDEKNAKCVSVSQSHVSNEGSRWIYEESVEEDIDLCFDDKDETFDCSRSFSDDEGFTVHALCKYTNEYAWTVFIESSKLPDEWYTCQSFSLEIRDEEAERYLITRIADQCIDLIAAAVEYELTGVCPSAGNPAHDEINSFVDGFLNEVL